MNPRLTGHCLCGEIQFQLMEAPLFVHTCHCLHCKRKTGSSFGITCIVLESDISIQQGKLIKKSDSSRTTSFECANCNTAIFKTNSNFKATAWLQTRCLEDLRELTIGAHTWVKRKDRWLVLPDDVPQFAEGYHRDEAWPRSSIERVEAWEGR